jgi:hypothetical protein
MSPAYNLFLVDESENKIPTTVASVENAATSAVIADIYSESYNWELTGANSWHGKHAYKVDPDKIHLCLHQDLRNCHKQWRGVAAPRAKQLHDKHGNIGRFSC